ncbi:sialidase [Aspergillus indologenus CBS 114.80]|uniref:Sialidase n=1 Tax=Aspergillus indologenus CBS 114.80 TaxID=1450541 RepID=A0A2V5JFG8_9EURO|nr:sialidase [Aspergillus indologenus CBS 114.80]
MSFLASSNLPGSFLGRMDWLHVYIACAAFTVCGFVALVLFASRRTRKVDYNSGIFTYLKFIYASFLKPHEKNGSGQQDALESFYKTQASVYDATRKRLLRGREDMLGLVAAQLKHKVDSQELKAGEAIWVDIGGGTGYNIEAMSAFLSVPDFFAHVYLVDLSPSLCEVARQRFQRLGWKNVSVVCQDARSFRLPEEDGVGSLSRFRRSMLTSADYYSVIDSLPALIKPSGVVGVCDFYVQSIVDVSSRNYIGGAFNRHVNWLGRAFWRAWFDADRVSLEAARRDYLEYRFGTVISASERNYLLGGIPYYIFVGCQKDSTTHSGRDAIEKLNASFTESPYLSPAKHRSEMDAAIVSSTQEIKSKAYESAVINLGSNLPLPSSFYQNHHYRIFYDDLLPKHTQFGNEYIYAFNWEDPRVDHKLLNIQRDDVILAITSAGDNILDYLQKSPRRVHAVDLNPNQNHLLELKVASFIALGHRDVWKIFGEGKHPDFRRLLITKLSAHLSSQAFQYWLEHTHVFTSSSGKGLYETGGSRHAIKMVRYLFKVFGLQSQVQQLCEAQTLAEQRKIWPKIRAVLMSKPLHWAVVGTEWFAWKAAGVPRNQRNMIIDDFYKRNGLNTKMKQAKDVSGQSIWEYVVDTLDPVVQDTLISNDNYFYFLCLQGQFSRRCHPAYLTPKAHVKLSSPGAFDGLRIHTDEINEVIKRITPKSLTIAVIMDSMDWFDPTGDAAPAQAQKLNHALKKGGRILLRSASIDPWYIRSFEANGFSARRVGARVPGTCIDRVNMYASTWICTKTRDLDRPAPSRAMSALSLNE